jgi:glycerol-3-phosphate acyltransferase PlsX
MKIYLDAMGGDNAPLAPVEGAKEALGLYPDLQIELAGPIETVQKTVDEVFGADAALRSRLTLTEEMVVSRGQISLDLIDLYRALGGGLASAE